MASGRGEALIHSSLESIEAPCARSGMVPVGSLPMLQPCDPDTTILLLRHALSRRPEDVNLDAVFDLVAQLVIDLQAWPHEP